MEEKKTKIICTIGPASDNYKTICAMVRAGMNVARLNFSHGTHETHLKTIETIRKVREKLNVPLPIMLDTKGPEFRIGTFKNGQVILSQDDGYDFYCEPKTGDEYGVSVSYNKLYRELEPGDKILVNNGLVSFEVLAINGKTIETRCITGGILSDRKSMSFPGKHLKLPYLSDQDKSDLLFGIEQDIDFVACSFVSCVQDVNEVRKFLDENGGKGIQIVAKIENQFGVDNAAEILEIAEGLMVARGDLGVEVPYSELPAIQKHLIRLSRVKGSFVITATEMLESMTVNPRPTRAEISDVANAVFDGTSAVMLSGETASGKYPVESVQAMTNIVLDAEKHTNWAKRFSYMTFEMDNLTDALSHSAAQLALDTNAACIVCASMSGFTARLLERCRVPMKVLGYTSCERTYRQMDMYWNVKPYLANEFGVFKELLGDCKLAVKELKIAHCGQVIVITGGFINSTGGTKIIHADILE